MTSLSYLPTLPVPKYENNKMILFTCGLLATINIVFGLSPAECDPKCTSCTQIGQCPGNSTINRQDLLYRGIEVQCFKINCDERPVLTWGSTTGCLSGMPESCDTCNSISIKPLITNSTVGTIGAPACGTSNPAFGTGGDTAVIVFNVSKQANASTLTWTCGGCPDPPSEPPQDSEDSNVSFLIAGILVILALIATAYCLYRHHCQKDTNIQARELANKQTRDVLLANEQRREARKQMAERNYEHQHQHQGFHEAEDKFDHKSGSCNIEFRNGDGWQRGEIISSLPGGMCIVSGTGDMEVVISKADVREIVNPLICEESSGFMSMRKRIPNGCKISCASEPSFSPKEVIQ